MAGLFFCDTSPAAGDNFPSPIAALRVARHHSILHHRRPHSRRKIRCRRRRRRALPGRDRGRGCVPSLPRARPPHRPTHTRPTRPRAASFAERNPPHPVLRCRPISPRRQPTPRGDSCPRARAHRRRRHRALPTRPHPRPRRSARRGCRSAGAFGKPAAR